MHRGSVTNPAGVAALNCSMQYSWPPRAVVEARDSLGPIVAPERAKASRSAMAAGRAARAGAAGGLVASAVLGVPYYFAVRDGVTLPWLQLAPMFVVFLVATSALYGAGAAWGARALASWLRPRGHGGRALVAFVGATLGAALVGPLPGSLGLAYFGSLPYPFIGMTTLAIAPVLGTALTSFGVSAALGEGSRARAALASAGAAALFCGVGALVLGTLDDATVVAAFRDATTTAGHEDSPLGLGIVGLFVGALLGAGLGGQMGLSLALSRAEGAA